MVHRRLAAAHQQYKQFRDIAIQMQQTSALGDEVFVTKLSLAALANRCTETFVKSTYNKLMQPRNEPYKIVERG